MHSNIYELPLHLGAGGEYSGRLKYNASKNIVFLLCLNINIHKLQPGHS